MAYVEDKLREKTRIIKQHFPDLPDSTLEKLYELAYNLFLWNTRINVISRKDILNVVEHHILHSLAILKFVKFFPGSVIVDIGSGGGLPALPLAIMLPENHIVAVESRGKKAMVIKEITKALNLQNVTTIHGRFENKSECRGHYFTGRAVAPLPQLVKWTSHRFIPREIPPEFSPQSLLYLKGNDIQHDIKFFEKKKIRYLIFNIYDAIPHPYMHDKVLLMVIWPY